MKSINENLMDQLSNHQNCYFWITEDVSDYKVSWNGTKTKRVRPYSWIKGSLVGAIAADGRHFSPCGAPENQWMPSVMFFHSFSESQLFSQNDLPFYLLFLDRA